MTCNKIQGYVNEMKVQTLTHLLVVEKSHLDTPPKYIVTGHLPSRTQWTLHSKPTAQEYHD